MVMPVVKVSSSGCAWTNSRRAAGAGSGVVTWLFHTDGRPVHDPTQGLVGAGPAHGAPGDEQRTALRQGDVGATLGQRGVEVGPRRRLRRRVLHRRDPGDLLFDA